MPNVETERLILRDFALSDWGALNAFVSDATVTRYMHFASWDEDKRRQWLERMVQNAAAAKPNICEWALTLRAGATLIGWLFIGGDDDTSGERECGYALDPRFWGQGYMTEALRAALAYEFTMLGAHRIIAECEVENLASARVMQKSGMAFEEALYNADFEGNWRYRHRYVITKSDDTHGSSHI
jgi:ribosomal-protein-alanine N-acetyltransferase